MTGIVVLNYNKWDDTYICIKSMIDVFRGKDKYKIYLVDNNSNTRLSTSHFNFYKDNNVKIIFHKENKGFSAGNNIGIEVAINDGMEYIMICNNDIIFIEDSLQKLKDFFLEVGEAVVVGPRVFLSNGKLQQINLTEQNNYSRKIKNIFRIRSKRNKLITQKMQEEGIVDNQVFFVSGCCFMVKKEVYDIIFPLDEDFFMYEEESVAGMKLMHKNYKVYLTNRTSIIHNHNFSKIMSPFLYRTFVYSEMLYLYKYLNIGSFRLCIIFYIRKFLYLYYSIKNREYFKNRKEFSKIKQNFKDIKKNIQRKK